MLSCFAMAAAPMPDSRSALTYINRGLPALIDAFGLRLRDALKLSLAPQIGFELSEDAEHVERWSRDRMFALCPS